jgi:hypothetical protein
VKGLFLIGMALLAMCSGAEAKKLRARNVCDIGDHFFPRNGELVQIEAVLWRYKGTVSLVRNTESLECLTSFEYPPDMASLVDKAESGTTIVVRGRYWGEFHAICSYRAIRANKIISIRRRRER